MGTNATFQTGMHEETVFGSSPRAHMSLHFLVNRAGKIEPASQVLVPACPRPTPTVPTIPSAPSLTSLFHVPQFL